MIKIKMITNGLKCAAYFQNECIGSYGMWNEQKEFSLHNLA